MTAPDVTRSPSSSLPRSRRGLLLPKWGTPRDLSRPTLGPKVAAVARMLGQPLMPWQQHVVDVVMEVDPATGRLVYREYVVIVGRQQGKTSLIRSKLAHRHHGFGKAQATVYTAQTADKARAKWRYDQVEAYEKSPLAELIAETRLLLNNERLTWTNGSTHSPVTPSSKTGGTGDSLDEAVIDEAWARRDNTVESAMRPAMVTRDQPQLGVLSTAKRPAAGEDVTNFAAYLRAKQRLGRARIEAGIVTDTAFFDYSAPRDADPADPATWWAHLPALGHTVTENAIASDFAAMERADFVAEYFGWWDDEAAGLWQVIGQQRWADLADRTVSPGYPLAFAVDAAPDRATSIGSAGPAAAGPAAGGLWCVELVDQGMGTDWAVDRMVGLVERWRPCAVVVNPAGAANSLIKPLQNALKAANLDPAVVKTPSLRDVSAGYGLFLDGAGKPDRLGPLRHAAQPELDAAVAGAWKRRVGSTWVWDWKSPCDVTPLVAASNALWGATVFGPAHQANDYDVMKSFY